MGAGPWMGEFREQLRAMFGEPVEPTLDLAAFDALPHRLRKSGLTREDVANELRTGVLGGREEDSRVILSTQRLEIRLHVERWRDTGTDITVLDNAWFRRGRLPERYVPVKPAGVTLHDPADAPRCDLTVLIEELDRRRLRREAERTLTRVRLTPQRQAGLRRDARRRYGSLRALFELARQQARFGDKATARGEVVDGAAWFGAEHPAAGELVIRLDAPAPFTVGDDAGRLTVWPSDDQGAAMTLEAAEVVDDMVVLNRPERHRDAETARRRLGLGTRVVMSETGEFRYGRHAQALHTFLDERTVGNWTALATLLCKPENLLHLAHEPVAEVAGRPLNRAQRGAVAGALAAPHAFLVQGPPGTGKTQVITEIASRLIARGERVLLTAPTHVALDEVLRRLADEPGVLPLRLSWNDRYVASDVQRFTLSGYDGAVAGVRTPENSRMEQWRSRLRQVTAQREAVTSWLSLAPRREASRQSTVAARRTAADRAAWHADQTSTFDAHLDQWRHTAGVHYAEAMRLGAEERSIYERRVAVERSRGAFGRFLDALGLGEPARLVGRERQLGRLRAEAWARHEGAQWEVDRRAAGRGPFLAPMAEQERADRAKIAAAERDEAELEWGLTRVAGRLAEHGLHAGPATAAALEESQSALEALIEVQQLWFDTIGASDAHEVARRAVSSAANLICTTTVGFGGARPFRDLDYDTLIVDEASKVTVGEFLIPAQRARRWILVGDEKQLTPYVEPAVEHHLHAMAAIHLAERDAAHTPRGAVEHLASLWHALDDRERHPFRVDSVERVASRLLLSGAWAEAHRKVYADQIGHVAGAADDPERTLLESMREHLVSSLFERCVARTPEDTGPRRRLVEQRRMTPEIAELVRMPVYDGEYTSPSADDPLLPRPLLTPSFRAPVVFLDTSTQSWPWDDLPEGTTSFVNHLEADWVAGVCRTWNDELGALGVPGRTTISVLAFYGAQARLIRGRLGHPRYARFPSLEFRVVDSIDRIQGQQSDIVVISFGRTFGRPKDRTRRPNPRAVPPPRWGPWLQNINRLNVACTRARRSLVLVGHRPTLRALNGAPEAEAFYRNLFGLPPDVLEVNVDWDGS